MQENNENIKPLENIDNIAEEETAEKNQSTSKIFFFVLGLHVLVIAGAIILHTMRAPSTSSTQTSSTQPGSTAQQPTSPTTNPGPTEQHSNLPVDKPAPGNISDSSLASTAPDKSHLQNSDITTPAPGQLSEVPLLQQQDITAAQDMHTETQEKQPEGQSEIFYIVRPGDSLSIIAKRYNTTVARIMRDNAKRNEKIAVGERLVIKQRDGAVGRTHTVQPPTQQPVGLPVAKVQFGLQPSNATKNAAQDTPTGHERAVSLAPQGSQIQNTTSDAPTATLANLQQHVVKKGDTLYSISKKYGHTVEDIKKWNSLESDKLAVGRTLRLSAPVTTNRENRTQLPDHSQMQTTAINSAAQANSPPANVRAFSTTSPEQTTPPPTPEIHIVSPGETLSSVARKYNTTVELIKENNKLSTDFITIGQKLTINPGLKNKTPQKQADYALVHIVKPGETLTSISKTYGVSIESLAAANQLQTPNITVGQKLTIPANVSEKPAPNTGTKADPPYRESAPKPTMLEKTQTETYTVQPGDTLFKIALKHGVSVESLSRANNLGAADILRVGQHLTIPPSDTAEVAKN